MYVLPNFQNPTGVTMSLERRQALIALSDHYGIPIIEDDPYGQLRYEGEHIKPLVVLDAECLECNAQREVHRQRHLPQHVQQDAGARAAARLGGRAQGSHHRLVQAKQGTDLHSSTFDQMVAYEVGRGGFLDGHVRRPARGLRPHAGT